MEEVHHNLRVGITYNAKQLSDDNLTSQQIAASVKPVSNSFFATFDENIVNNYPERIDDTYAEWDSMETIEAVQSALESAGHEVDLIEADTEAYARLSELRNEFVFNLAEGLGGSSRESQIPAMLDMLGIHYTGSDPVTTGICHDKSRCKEILSYYGVPNTPFVISDDPDSFRMAGSFPKFVKPLHEGSSKGIYNTSLVTNNSDLRSEISRIKDCYNQPAIIEDYLPGKEFTVAMLGNGADTKALPVIEINLDTVPEGFNRIYSYEVKWFFDTRESKLDIFRCPADIPESLYRQIENVCLDAYRVLRVRDWARIDIRLDSNGIPNVVEVNPLPGILPDPADNSCFPKAARQAGLSYNEMINAVLNEAVKRVKDSESR